MKAIVSDRMHRIGFSLCDLHRILSNDYCRLVDYRGDPESGLPTADGRDLSRRRWRIS